MIFCFDSDFDINYIWLKTTQLMYKLGEWERIRGEGRRPNLQQPQLEGNFRKHIVPQPGEDVGQSVLEIGSQFGYHLLGVLIQKHV